MTHRARSGDPVVDAVLGTAHLLRERANAELATCGLSLWTFKSLRALAELGPSRSVDLSEHLGMAARTVTGAVDALEAEGLVERTTHPTDRRAHLIVLTDRGRDRLDQAVVVHAALLDRATGALTDAERAELLALLDRLTAALDPAAV